VLLNSNSRWSVSDPLARFARVSPHEGEISSILPLREGESRRMRQGVAHTLILRSWAIGPLAGAGRPCREAELRSAASAKADAYVRELKARRPQ
jgi:hypothetical protein